MRSMIECDNDSDVWSRSFDLTQSEAEILVNVGTGTYVVTYYEDAALTIGVL